MGELLCEVLFAAGREPDAIELAEDIYYNLNNFYGCFDPSTQNIVILLSSFYTAIGQPCNAIPLHRNILLHIFKPKEWRAEPERKDIDVAHIGFNHARLLKLAYQRSGEGAQSNETATSEAIKACKDLSGEQTSSWIELGLVTEWKKPVGTILKNMAHGFWENLDLVDLWQIRRSSRLRWQNVIVILRSYVSCIFIL